MEWNDTIKIKQEKQRRENGDSKTQGYIVNRECDHNVVIADKNDEEEIRKRTSENKWIILMEHTHTHRDTTVEAS